MLPHSLSLDNFFQSSPFFKATLTHPLPLLPLSASIQFHLLPSFSIMLHLSCTMLSLCCSDSAGLIRCSCCWAPCLAFHNGSWRAGRAASYPGLSCKCMGESPQIKPKLPSLLYAFHDGSRRAGSCPSHLGLSTQARGRAGVPRTEPYRTIKAGALCSFLFFSFILFYFKSVCV